MHTVIDSFLSVGIPSVALVLSAILLARREDRELRGETRPADGKRMRIPTIDIPDHDAHLGRVGSE
jgi:hypothetical protein